MVKHGIVWLLLMLVLADGILSMAESVKNLRKTIRCFYSFFKEKVENGCSKE